MKIERLGMLLLCVLILVGCGTSETNEENQKKILFQGLNGLETYREAVALFNKDITYYSSQVTEEKNVTTLEAYAHDQDISLVTKGVYSESGETTLSYTIATQGTFHTLYMIDNFQYKYNVIENYTESQTQIYEDAYAGKGYSILEATRKDVGDEIYLTLKVKLSQKYQESDETEDVSYILSEIKINKDGYIYEKGETYYEDETFSKKQYQGTVIINSMFNQKNKTDLQREIELMKSCDGLGDEDVRMKLGIKL